MNNRIIKRKSLFDITKNNSILIKINGEKNIEQQN